MDKMHFTRMDQGTAADFEVMKKVHEYTLATLPDKLYGLLDNLAKDTAYNITRKEHCLQALLGPYTMVRMKSMLW
ncbi:hypothetical protein [Polynucleobacter paneuropaeus]|uniref:hypothetical protein n=1 Tax=Polynucleobacter paneuropaeus TaxID=2527775 RepID=UPI001BFED1D2|nr:hypothetical protein [Polynucleobacter paneuropaeus]